MLKDGKQPLMPQEFKDPCVHFVGFLNRHWRQWHNAVKVFGKPDFVHMAWDTRARREIGVNDTVVFVKGEHDQDVVKHNTSDIVEEKEPPYEHRPQGRNRKVS